MYLLSPHASSPWTGTTKCLQDYLAFLVIYIVLDAIQYKLRHLGNRVLLDTFHTNRQKSAFVSTLFSEVNTLIQLTKAIEGTNNI